MKKKGERQTGEKSTVGERKPKKRIKRDNENHWEKK